MNSRGFTLVEVIVAMGVAALVASLAYQSLSVASESAIRTTAAAERINHIDRAWQLLETDLRHLVARGGTDPLGGGEIPPLEGGEASDYTLYFVRGGWVNPLNQQRSLLQRVGYLMEDDTLWRYYWYRVDGTGNEEPQKLDLLEKVSSVRVRFLPGTARGIDESQWQVLWPVRGGDTKELPAAVEVTLELEDMGEITRLFALASG
ncbi:MAG: type II secretion system minor pseudopilin GspJ [Exilibacterium sp.]